MRGSGSSIERIVIDEERLTVPGHLSRVQSSSQLSDLTECVFFWSENFSVSTADTFEVVLSAIKTLGLLVTRQRRSHMSKLVWRAALGQILKPQSI
jgi:hypothetical protein